MESVSISSEGSATPQTEGGVAGYYATIQAVAPN
jgi:hypothetical protein